MSTLSGIDFETDTVTKKRYVRIDFDRYGKAIMPFFEQIGVINRDDDFWKEYTTGITGDELRQYMYQRIDAWKWNEKYHKQPCFSTIFQVNPARADL